MPYRNLSSWMYVLTLPAVLLISPAASAGPEGWTERLRNVGITGGLVVHVGADATGETEAALVGNGQFLVHSLCIDWATVHALRRNLATRKVFPLANAALLRDPADLPLKSGLVRAMIVHPAAMAGNTPPDAEILRVLAYGGRAWIHSATGYREVAKNTPDTVDDWGYPFHGPDRIALSKDREVGPVTGLRWVAGTRYNNRSPAGLRIVGGRVFSIKTIMTTGRRPDVLYGSRTNDPRIWLEARDAASGVVIWRRGLNHADLPSGGKAYWTSSDFFVATERAVYTYPSVGSPLTAFDPASGEILQTYDDGLRLEGKRMTEGWNKGSINVSEYQSMAILIKDGRIIQTMRDGGFVCLDEKSGKVLYRNVDLKRTSYPAWVGDLLVLLDSRDGRTSCLAFDTRTGQKRWEYQVPETRETMMFADRGSVVLSINVGTKGGIHGTYDTIALDTDTGKQRWVVPRKYNTGRGNIFPADGKVWYMDAYTRFETLDPATGKMLNTMSYAGSGGGCGIEVLTPDWIVRGTFLVPRDTPATTYAVNVARPNCEIPMYPAYGSLFATGTECGCGWYLPGSAFGLHTARRVRPLPDRQRLIHLTSQPVVHAARVRCAIESPLTRDWTWTADPIDGIKYARWFQWKAGGSMGPTQNDELKEVFGVNNDKVRWYTLEYTKPVTAGDLTLVAHVPGQTLEARRADGSVAWTFLAGARITVEPRVLDNLAFIGCNDGWIYALNIMDGSIAWQYLAAPEDLAMVAFGAVESTWPVFGTLLRDGTIYYQAGRSTAIDEGLWAGALDARTGGVKWTGRAVAYAAKLDVSELSNTYQAFSSWATGLNAPLQWHNGKVLYLHSNHHWDPENPMSQIVNEARRITPKE